MSEVKKLKATQALGKSFDFWWQNILTFLVLAAALFVLQFSVDTVFEVTTGVDVTAENAESQEVIDVPSQETQFEKTVTMVYQWFNFLVLLPITMIASYYVCSELLAGRKPVVARGWNCIRARWWMVIKFYFFLAIRVVLFLLPGLALLAASSVGEYIATGESGEVTEPNKLLPTLGIVAMIILGIYAAIRYAIAFYFAMDPEESSANQAIKKSENAFKGHRFSFAGSYVLLTLILIVGFVVLSFIAGIVAASAGEAGAILVIILMGVATLLVAPVYNFIGLIYYNHIRENTTPAKEK